MYGPNNSADKREQTKFTSRFCFAVITRQFVIWHSMRLRKPRILLNCQTRRLFAKNFKQVNATCTRQKNYLRPKTAKRFWTFLPVLFSLRTSKISNCRQNFLTNFPKLPYLLTCCIFVTHSRAWNRKKSYRKCQVSFFSRNY